MLPIIILGTLSILLSVLAGIAGASRNNYKNMWEIQSKKAMHLDKEASHYKDRTKRLEARFTNHKGNTDWVIRAWKYEKEAERTEGAEITFNGPFASAAWKLQEARVNNPEWKWALYAAKETIVNEETGMSNLPYEPTSFYTNLVLG